MAKVVRVVITKAVVDCNKVFEHEVPDEWDEWDDMMKSYYRTQCMEETIATNFKGYTEVVEK